MPKEYMYKWWIGAAILLLIPAFVINLNLLTINEDEAIRALVALEMQFSKNLITPTLNGDFYYAKPPLYNWILLLIYQCVDNINEWTLRLPTVVFLFSFAGTIYYYTKKHFSKEYAWINAFLFLTCGRILFWDSMLGYIDVFYSWITFIQFMVIYHLFKKEKISQLFLLSYLLTAVGFMLKGFPALLFQGISLLAIFWYSKRIKELFTWSHVKGIGVFALLIGVYYVSYFQFNELNDLFDSLLDQSTRRTIVHEKNPISDFFIHLVSYPLENLYHFFPWALLLLYLFKKSSFQVIKANDFLWYCSVIFLANIIVYWASPEVYPRYILMLIPLLFTVLLGLHKAQYDEHSLLYRYLIFFFLGLMIIAGMACFYIPFLPQIDLTVANILKAYLPAVALLSLAWFYFHQKQNRFIILIVALLVMRIVFNFFVLPDRLKNDYATHCRTQALSIGERYADKDFRIYKRTKIDWTSSFYISKTRGAITYHDSIASDPNAFYALDTILYDVPVNCKVIEEFDVREFKRTLFIIQCE